MCPPETNALNKESSFSSGLQRAGCPGSWRRPLRASQLFQNVRSGATWNPASGLPRANQPQDRSRPTLWCTFRLCSPCPGGRPSPGRFQREDNACPVERQRSLWPPLTMWPIPRLPAPHLWLLHPTSILGRSHHDPREYLRGTWRGLPPSYRPWTDGWNQEETRISTGRALKGGGGPERGRFAHCSVTPNLPEACLAAPTQRTVCLSLYP